MAEFSAMPLWTDAYLGDTTHLSTVEHGAYLLLLITAWRSKDGLLPNNDSLLAKYVRLTPGQWQRIRPVIEKFFTVSDKNWKQGRLMDELDAVRRKSKRGSDHAKSRWLKAKQNADAAASFLHDGCIHSAMPNPCEPDASHTRIHTHTTNNPLNPPEGESADVMGESLEALADVLDESEEALKPNRKKKRKITAKIKQVALAIWERHPTGASKRNVDPDGIQFKLGKILDFEGVSEAGEDAYLDGINRKHEWMAKSEKWNGEPKYVNQISLYLSTRIDLDAPFLYRPRPEDMEPANKVSVMPYRKKTFAEEELEALAIRERAAARNKKEQEQRELIKKAKEEEFDFADSFKF